MREKIKRGLCLASSAVLLAGIFMALMGLYYWVIKAGLPYQDPPLELQIQYAIYMGIGDILVKNGLLTAGIGGILRLIIGNLPMRGNF
ncbi:hypothetical protein AALB64_01710 [Lachnospiraceae bacterium 45-P1]